jgi:hypothetical protein
MTIDEAAILADDLINSVAVYEMTLIQASIEDDTVLAAQAIANTHAAYILARQKVLSALMSPTASQQPDIEDTNGQVNTPLPSPT